MIKSFFFDVSKWLIFGFSRKNSDQNDSPKLEAVGFSPFKRTSYIWTIFSRNGDLALVVEEGVELGFEPGLFRIETDMAI